MHRSTGLRELVSSQYVLLANNFLQYGLTTPIHRAPLPQLASFFKPRWSFHLNFTQAKRYYLDSAPQDNEEIEVSGTIFQFLRVRWNK